MLTTEERDLLSVAYKNATASRRSSLNALHQYQLETVREHYSTLSLRVVLCHHTVGLGHQLGTVFRAFNVSDG